MRHQGKVAIVTGGGRDIGRACAMRLARDGAKVAISYQASSAGAESAVGEITENGGQAIAVQADLTRSDDVEKLVSATQEAFGADIDVLIHVTGGLVARKTIEEMDEAYWQKVIDLNATSLFRMVKATTPHMPDGGAIVAFASQAARDGGGPGAVAYAASKGAVMTMARGLAKELSPRIRVNAICPGMINTDFHNIFTKNEARKNVAAATPLKREGMSAEVANLAAYLASDEASFITGANVDINGGTLFS